jgi:hypothetical protein
MEVRVNDTDRLSKIENIAEFNDENDSVFTVEINHDDNFRRGRRM